MSRRWQPSSPAATLLACGLMLAVWWPVACRRPASSSSDRIRVTTSAYLADAAMFIALDQGIFSAHGLDVEVEPLNSATAAMPLLSEGSLDVAQSGPINPRSFNLIQRGAAFRMVAGRDVYTTEGCPSDAFLVRSDLLAAGRVTDAASLRGLRITTERTASNYYYFDRLLASGGLTMQDVVLIDMPVPARGDALAKGLIDVTTASEPWATRLVRDGHAKIWKRVSDVLPARQRSFVLFGRRLLEDEHGLGTRFLAAFLEAERRLREEGKSFRNIESIARWTHFDPEELRAMCWPTSPADPTPDRETLDDFQRWALANQLIDSYSPYEKLVDLSFLDAMSPAERAGRGGG